MNTVPQKMKAVVVRGPKQAAVEMLSTPTAQPGEVLVQIDTCLICTWEQRIYETGGGMALPFVPGHEIAGRIAAVPEGTVTSFKVGDPVVGKTLDACGHCEYCYRGDDNQCIGAAKKRFYDGIPGSGGMAQYIALAVNRVYPVYNPDLPMGVAAFAEPVSCCLRSMDRAALEYGDDVVIVGGGVMGQLHSLLAQKRGARVMVAEPNPFRAAMAKQRGAHAVIDPTRLDAVQAVKDWTGGIGAQTIFYTLPMTSPAQDYLDALSKLGRMVYYGSFKPADDIAVNPNAIHYSEKVITGAYSPTSKGFFIASKLLSHGLINAEPLLTRVFPVEELDEAFRLSASLESFRVGVRLD